MKVKGEKVRGEKGGGERRNRCGCNVLVGVCGWEGRGVSMYVCVCVLWGGGVRGVFDVRSGGMRGAWKWLC